MSDIGFIGVGNMGTPMVRNLLAAGHSLTVYDLSPEAVSLAVQAGAKAAGSAADVARGAAFVVTMLPVGANVREVYLDQGVIAAAEPGALLIDCSTIDVATSQAVHAAAAAAGVAMLDAPVSGGTMGAEAATLTFMCGGEAAAFAAARPVLSAMGRNLIHCGAPGLGQAAKICNNMVAGIATVAISESFALGERLGLDRQTLFDVLSTSSADCWVLEHMCPAPGPVPSAPSCRDYAPGFAAALMLKDLRLAEAAAEMAASPTPLGALAAALYALHVNAGNGHLDTSSIFTMIRGDAG